MTDKLLDISLEHAVWTYRRDGVDYGPFSSGEIIEQLGEDELTRTDVLLEHNTNKVLRIEEISAFLPALEASEERRWEQKLDRETKRSFSEIRKGQRRRPIFVLSLLIFSIAVGWVLFSKLSGSAASGTVAFALVPVTPPTNLDFVAFTPPPEEPAPVQEVKAAPNKGRARQKRKPRAKVGGVNAGTPVPVVTTIDFSNPDVMNGSNAQEIDGPAPLGHSEFQRYRTELQPKLLNCIRNHNQKLDAGSYRLEFKVLRDGSASQAQVRPASANSRDLEFCANSLLGMNKMRAFSGSSRELSLGFQVTTSVP